MVPTSGRDGAGPGRRELPEPQSNAVAAPQIRFTREQIELIRRTVAPSASDDELAYFLAQCQRTGLDPFTGQIYFAKDNRGRVRVMTSIQGFRLIAERTGRYRGQTHPEWCDADGQWHQVWLKPGKPAAARIGVHVAGYVEPVWGVVHLREFERASPTWSELPAHMLLIAAERQALGKAFQQETCGLLTDDEFHRINELERRAPASPERPGRGGPDREPRKQLGPPRERGAADEPVETVSAAGGGRPETAAEPARAPRTEDNRAILAVKKEISQLLEKLGQEKADAESRRHFISRLLGREVPKVAELPDEEFLRLAELLRELPNQQQRLRIAWAAYCRAHGQRVDDTELFNQITRDILKAESPGMAYLLPAEMKELEILLRALAREETREPVPNDPFEPARPPAG